MARTAQETEQLFLATVKEETGEDLAGWMARIAGSGETKSVAITKWIKAEYGLNHMQANMLSSIYLNDGKPVYDYKVMFERLFAGKEAQLPLYQELERYILDSMPGVKIFPTKTYVSIDRDRNFATVKINRSNLRVGLDLGDMPFGDYVVKGIGLGAMPRISHMIEIQTADDINEKLLSYLELADQRVNG